MGLVDKGVGRLFASHRLIETIPPATVSSLNRTERDVAVFRVDIETYSHFLQRTNAMPNYHQPGSYNLYVHKVGVGHFIRLINQVVVSLCISRFGSSLKIEGIATKSCRYKIIPPEKQKSLYQFIL